MSPAPLAQKLMWQDYIIEQINKQNIIGKKNCNFAKGAG